MFLLNVFKSCKISDFSFQLSDESDSSHWYDRDENKENICPSLRQNHPYRIFTTPIDEFSIQDLEPDNE